MSQGARASRSLLSKADLEFMAKLLARRFPDWRPPHDSVKKQSGYVERKVKALDYSKWLSLRDAMRCLSGSITSRIRTMPLGLLSEEV